jgi:hypothetical protein
VYIALTQPALEAQSKRPRSRVNLRGDPQDRSILSQPFDSRHLISAWLTFALLLQVHVQLEPRKARVGFRASRDPFRGHLRLGCVLRNEDPLGP